MAGTYHAFELQYKFIIMFRCLIYFNCPVIDGDRVPWPTSPPESCKAHWLLL
jgi:hypothetical protein